MDPTVQRVPILRLKRRLLVSIQGDITDDVAQRLSDEILGLLHDEGAQGLVLDVTGVWTMDSHLCSVLSRLAESARLMGTATVVSGLSPEIAQTLQTMGIDLEIESASTVERALTLLGLEVTEARVDEDESEAMRFGSGGASTPTSPFERILWRR